ncbi:MAG: hypothetical protein KDB18_09710 [Salinibacterium sp.]|nr:hypothetical protein [Salinibacterium sp.]
MTDTDVLRKLHTHIDALHAFVYFRPEAGLNFAAAGLTGMDAYFASRAAPLGAVGAEAVTATFYNFNHRIVSKSVPKVWDIASPEQVLEIRMRSADEALRKMLGDVVEGPEVARAAELTRRAAGEATMPGRPLYAANAALDWPEPAHLQLFHAVTLLREYRGDAHVAALVLNGVGAVETLVLDVVSGRSKLGGPISQSTRGWSDEEWAAGFESLKAKGLVGGDEALNEDGLALRERLEVQTDEASLGVWGVLSEQEVDELVALTKPLIQTVATQMFGT